MRTKDGGYKLIDLDASVHIGALTAAPSTTVYTVCGGAKASTTAAEIIVAEARRRSRCKSSV